MTAALWVHSQHGIDDAVIKIVFSESDFQSEIIEAASANPGYLLDVRSGTDATLPSDNRAIYIVLHGPHSTAPLIEAYASFPAKAPSQPRPLTGALTGIPADYELNCVWNGYVGVCAGRFTFGRTAQPSLTPPENLRTIETLPNP